jgi:hypothetical protein
MINRLISTPGNCAVRPRAKYFGEGGGWDMMDKVKDGTVADGMKIMIIGMFY